MSDIGAKVLRAVGLTSRLQMSACRYSGHLFSAVECPLWRTAMSAFGKRDRFLRCKCLLWGKADMTIARRNVRF